MNFKIVGYGIPTKEEMEQLINDDHTKSLIENSIKSPSWYQNKKSFWVRNDNKKADECEVAVFSTTENKVVFEKRNCARSTNCHIAPCIYIKIDDAYIKDGMIIPENQVIRIENGNYNIYVSNIKKNNSYGKNVFIGFFFSQSYAFQKNRELFDYNIAHIYYLSNSIPYNRTSPRKINFEQTTAYSVLQVYVDNFKTYLHHAEKKEI